MSMLGRRTAPRCPSALGEHALVDELGVEGLVGHVVHLASELLAESLGRVLPMLVWYVGVGDSFGVMGVVSKTRAEPVGGPRGGAGLREFDGWRTQTVKEPSQRQARRSVQRSPVARSGRLVAGTVGA